MILSTKKKPLVVALSLALLSAPVGVAIADVNQPHFDDINLDHSEKRTITEGNVKMPMVMGQAELTLHGKDNNSSNVTSTGGTFSNQAKESIIYGKSAHQIFIDNSTQDIKNDSQSVGNSFRDKTKQTINDKATSRDDKFSIESAQQINSGTAVNGEFRDVSSQHVQGLQSASENAQFYNSSTQLVTSGSLSVNSQFNDASAQSVLSGAVSKNSTFHDGAVQYVTSTYGEGTLLEQSKSENDVFKDGSQQAVYTGGIVFNASFENNSSQLLQVASALPSVHTAKSIGSTFKDGARQSVGGGTLSFNNSFAGNSSQTVHRAGYTSGATFSDNASQILEDEAKAQDTTFNDNASAIIASNASMAGTTTMNGNSVLTALAGDQIINEEPQIENLVINEGARLNILSANNSNNANSDVTAGTITMNGGTIQFGHEGGSERYSTLFADTVSGTGGNLIMNGNLATHNNDLLSAGTMSGHYDIVLNNQDSGKELSGLGDLLTLVEFDENKGATFDLTTVDRENNNPNKPTPGNHGSDQGTHKVKIDTQKDPATGKTIVNLVTDISKTSNTTDAVMGLASATQYIFDGEMQALRSRRGDIQRFDQGDGGVWGRYLHNSSDIKAGAGADYSLGQNGMELGGDKVFDVAGGKLSVGAMTSYSKSSVKQRGDSSQVSSYGVGLYSSYLSSVGYYIDGVLKLNHFNNDLRTRTDRGQAVKGSYDQDGYGASVEAGYQYTLGDGINVDPYVRASYFAAQGKDMELSNGMKAAIGSQKSAKGELGVSVGKAFEVRSLTLSPYVTAAVEHEFLKDNKVTFNDRYTYKNDQSGTLGKFGAGMTAQVTKNAQVYVEADYRKGNKVESPIMGNAGFRINF